MIGIFELGLYCFTVALIYSAWFFTIKYFDGGFTWADVAILLGISSFISFIPLINIAALIIASFFLIAATCELLWRKIRHNAFGTRARQIMTKKREYGRG